MSFVNDVLNGLAHENDIESYIKEWDRLDHKQDLLDYLGLTPQEYTYWFVKPEAIYDIIGKYKAYELVYSQLAQELIEEW